MRSGPQPAIEGKREALLAALARALGAPAAAAPRGAGASPGPARRRVAARAPRARSSSRSTSGVRTSSEWRIAIASVSRRSCTWRYWRHLERARRARPRGSEAASRRARSSATRVAGRRPPPRVSGASSARTSPGREEAALVRSRRRCRRRRSESAVASFGPRGVRGSASIAASERVAGAFRARGQLVSRSCRRRMRGIRAEALIAPEELVARPRRRPPP